MLSSVITMLMRRQARGSTALTKRLRAYSRRSNVVLARNRFGAHMHLDPFDYIDGFVIRHGYYESEIIEALEKSIRPGDVFWDVGSNSGLHAVTIGARHPDVEVFAFEPSPREVARIHQNIVANELGNVAVLPWALAQDEFALKEFHLAHGNAGMNSFSAWAGEAAYVRTVVAAVSGDRLVRDGAVPAPNLLKIDVEGAERVVLEGLRDVLAGRGCRTVVFEAADPLEPAIAELFAGFGYGMRMLARREPTAHGLENYVAERAER